MSSRLSHHSSFRNTISTTLALPRPSAYHGKPFTRNPGQKFAPLNRYGGHPSPRFSWIAPGARRFYSSTESSSSYLDWLDSTRSIESQAKEYQNRLEADSCLDRSITSCVLNLCQSSFKSTRSNRWRSLARFNRRCQDRRSLASSRLGGVTSQKYLKTVRATQQLYLADLVSSTRLQALFLDLRCQLG